jgi:hypothetical protein
MMRETREAPTSTINNQNLRQESPQPVHHWSTQTYIHCVHSFTDTITGFEVLGRREIELVGSFNERRAFGSAEHILHNPDCITSFIHEVHTARQLFSFMMTLLRSYQMPKIGFLHGHG